MTISQRPMAAATTADHVPLPQRPLELERLSERDRWHTHLTRLGSDGIGLFRGDRNLPRLGAFEPHQVQRTAQTLALGIFKHRRPEREQRSELPDHRPGVRQVRAIAGPFLVPSLERATPDRGQVRLAMPFADLPQLPVAPYPRVIAVGLIRRIRVGLVGLDQG